MITDYSVEISPRRWRRTAFQLLLIIVGVSVALAQQPSASTPSVDRLQQVISYLASDALEGRRTGTPGANDAAHYIAGEMNRYGLRPGIQMARPARTRGENLSRYLQPFPFVSSVELGKNNLFFVNPGRADDTAQFMVSQDWMPLGFSSNASIKGAEMIFAGYGISSAELKYDDYAVSNVRDDSPASKAGLKAGDKIVKMAGREVKNVYDYTYALGEMKAGQEYEVEVVRGSERLTLRITPAVRKQ